MPPESNLCMLLPKPFIVVIGMNTSRETTQRAYEGIVNAGDHENQVPPQDNQVHPLEHVAMGDKVPVD